MKVSTKALKWRSALSEVEKIKDGVGLGVEPEVMELVAAMRLHHFRTTASCAGHLDRITSGPFVRFESWKGVECFDEAEKNREQLIASGSYKDRLERGRMHTWQEMHRMYKLITRFKKDTGEYSSPLIVQYIMNKNIILQCYGVEFLSLMKEDERRVDIL